MDAKGNCRRVHSAPVMQQRLPVVTHSKCTIILSASVLGVMCLMSIMVASDQLRYSTNVQNPETSDVNWTHAARLANVQHAGLYSSVAQLVCKTIRAVVKLWVREVNCRALQPPSSSSSAILLGSRLLGSC